MGDQFLAMIVHIEKKVKGTTKPIFIVNTKQMYLNSTPS